MKMALEEIEPARDDEKGRRVLRTERGSPGPNSGKPGQHKEDVMRYIRLSLVAMLLAVPFLAVSTAHAQVAVGVGVGPDVVAAPYAYGPPDCEWGYYAYYPYACAPYGYYGPNWFVGGVFIGVGPWYGWGWGRGWGYGGWGYRGGYGYRGAYGGYGYRGGYAGRGYAGGVGRGYAGGAAPRGYAGGGVAHGYSGGGAAHAYAGGGGGFHGGGGGGGFHGGGGGGGGRR